MTPTERAKAIVKNVGLLCFDFDDAGAACQSESDCPCGADVAAVADHIRRAENDALERVALWLDTTRYSSALAQNVRAMKHEVAG